MIHCFTSVIFALHHSVDAKHSEEISRLDSATARLSPVIAGMWLVSSCGTAIGPEGHRSGEQAGGEESDDHRVREDRRPK